MKARLVLAGVLAILLVGLACSPGDDGGQNRGGGNDERDRIIEASGRQDAAMATETKEADGGLGQAVEVGSISLRVFDVRARDRIYAVSGPGAEPVTKGNGFGEFVAVDYVAKNVSGSPVTTRARATLVDDQGNSYEENSSIEPPAGGANGMELGTDRKGASTMFFQVPNGISPERLEVRTPNDVARIDLLDTHPDEIPPEDYLRVYHAYFNERAGEEAYEMLDPASVQDITLGEWLAFYEPLWGERYLNLDGLRRISADNSRAVFAMERTLYDAEGDPLPDPELDPSVVQEMVRDGREWKLVMRDDLVSDIVAVIGPDETPRPETTEPETTEPETTEPERTAPELTLPPVTTPETVPELTQPPEATALEETTGVEPTTAADQAPEDTLAAQYEYVNVGDYGAAYDLFDSQSQQLVSSEQYRSYFESLAPYEITSYSFPSVQIQGETASLVVDLVVSSSAGVEAYQVTQQMVLEDGGWRAVMRDEQVAAFTG